MQAVLVDDRLDPGQFGDLMDQGVGVLSRQRLILSANSRSEGKPLY